MTDLPLWAIITLFVLFGPLGLAFTVIVWGFMGVVIWALCRSVWGGLRRGGDG